MESFEDALERLPAEDWRQELRNQLAWLAGLLEAEGTFLKPPPSDGRPRIVCYMGDEDVVERMAKATGTVAFGTTRADRSREMFTALLKGYRAVLLMHDLLPLMGERRSRRIREIVGEFQPPVRKLSHAAAAEIRRQVKLGVSVSALSRQFGVSRPTIRQVREGSIYATDSAPRWRSGRSVVPPITVIPEGISPRELYWLAGWLDGEGSFCAPPPSDPRRARICGCTTDEDVGRAVARLLGVTPTYSHTESARAKGWSATWRALKRGTGAVQLMKALYPLMGIRRQAQIERALAAIGESPFMEAPGSAPGSAKPASMRPTSVPIGV
jgi:transposase-like protein